jgi:Cof subfamily protein (haloacid dehalogenase superfamily)
MTHVSLVVSDVDGTLVTPDKRLTPAALSAVEALRRRGILFTITSSRPPFGMRSVCDALHLDLPIGAFNGSSIVNPDMSVVEQTNIPATAARRSLSLLARHNIDAWLFTDGEWLVMRDDGRYVANESRTIASTPRMVGDFGRAIDEACKIVGVSSDFALLERCEKELQAELGNTAHAARSQNYYLDVTPPDRDKGTFVETLAGRLGVGLDDVITIGDMTNDLPMFAKGGRSIAMGNASEAVKARATEVTDSNDADGFAKAMQRLLRATG